MKRTKSFVLIMSLLGSLTAIFAEKINEMEPIVVTASRFEEPYENVNRKIEIVNQDDLESVHASELCELLTGMPSVAISNYGGLGGTKNIRMRGSSAAQVLVMIDGIPINNPRDGTADLNRLPLDNIDRIEMMYGPGSTQYGSYAMGGTLNVITKKPPRQGQETTASVSGGSYETIEATLSHGARINQFGYLVTGQYQNSEGFRTNSDIKAYHFSAKLEYDINDRNHLQFNSNYFDNETGSPGPISMSDADDQQKNRIHSNDLTWDFIPDKSNVITTRVYKNKDHLTFLENTASSFFDVPYMESDHTTEITGWDMQWKKEYSETWQWVTGLNGVENTNESTVSGNHDYKIRSAYLENHLDLTDRIRISFGTRVDDYSNLGTEWSPDFSFLYKIDDCLKIHGLIANCFRAPTFNDLYWPDEGWARGNPGLNPEEGTAMELGAEKRIGSLIKCHFTYYRNEYTDLINWMEKNGVWQPENIDSTLTQGIELENVFTPSEGWVLTLKYSYMEAKDKDTDHDLIYQPKNRIQAGLEYKGAGDLSFRIKGIYTDSCFQDPENSVKIEDYFILDTGVSKKWRSRFTFYLNLDNLLDEDYQVILNYPMPGFSVTGGVKIEFS
ncbi:MAG: TonB-dependent receptor [Candidatus Aureabacteria bacterium]|nr:TonB-dependent receptor [Candidatus Auribacterota bacterium]